MLVAVVLSWLYSLVNLTLVNCDNSCCHDKTTMPQYAACSAVRHRRGHATALVACRATGPYALFSSASVVYTYVCVIKRRIEREQVTASDENNSQAYRARVQLDINDDCY